MDNGRLDERQRPRFVDLCV